jgi:hypothetical protein
VDIYSSIAMILYGFQVARFENRLRGLLSTCESGLAGKSKRSILCQGGDEDPSTLRKELYKVAPVAF